MDQLAILLVDDEETIRTYLAEFLSRLGYQVRCADSGGQALEMLSHDSFDVVILDVLLPDLSGLEVLERYRARGDRSRWWCSRASTAPRTRCGRCGWGPPTI